MLALTRVSTLRRWWRVGQRVSLTLREAEGEVARMGGRATRDGARGRWWLWFKR
jgi:hypothetical protein